MDIAILSTPYELNLRSDIARRDLDLEEKTKFLNKADIHIDRLVSNRDGLFSIHKNENGKEVAFNFEEEESEGTIILLALNAQIYFPIRFFPKQFYIYTLYFDFASSLFFYSILRFSC